jgi:hypothetical protein
VIALAAPAGAITRPSVFVSASASSPDDIDGDFEDVFDTTADSLSRTMVASVPGASANTFAQAGYGWARASTSTQAIGSEDHGSQGGAQGRFQDDLVITAPGIANGTSGTLVFEVEVGGSITASAGSNGPGTDATSRWNISYQFPGIPSTRLVEGSLFEGAGGPVQDGQLSGGSFESPPISFQFGTPFALSMALNAEAGSNEGAVAAAQFSNALEWQGLAVFHGGDPVLDFTVTSGSGANWAGPITAPEPAAGGVALSVLAALRRRASRAA